MEVDSGNMFVRPPPVTQPLDIVVPTHNIMAENFDRGLSLTIRCIHALYNNTLAPFHLIVVDDSTDKLTPLYFKELKKELKKIDKELTYIRSFQPYKEGNQYLNEAFKHSKYPYIACVGNSITVEPEWEVAALELLGSDKSIGIVGFKNLYPEGAFSNTIESAGISMVNYTPVDIGRDLPSHRQTSLYECLAVQWAFCMVRKDAVTNPSLPEGVYNGFKGWDDIDNCFVLRKRGWKVLYNGYGVGYHFPRATRGSSTEVTHNKNRENARRFYKRWGLWDKFIKEYPGDWPEAVEGAVPIPE